MSVQKSLAEAEPEPTPQEGKRVGTVSLRTYYDFFKAGGGIFLVTVALLLFILGEVRASQMGVLLYLILTPSIVGWNCCVRLVAF